MKIHNFGCRVFQGVFGLVNRSLKENKQQLIQGAGSFLHVKSVLREQGCRMPMVVTGPRIAASAFFQNFARDLKGEYVLFAEVKPDPPVSQIEGMVALYRANRCDGIVAIGGGSNMDAAKAMAARLARPDKPLTSLGGVLKVNRPTPFFIAVPTTAGTGSECTVAAVVTDDKAHHKYAINDPVLLPDVAILDPELTASLPKALTAYTGMDALTHAVEAYLNKPYHKANTARLAEEAVQAIFANIRRVCENGSDLAAREAMLLASYKAGQAFTVACVGNVHAIAHTFGGLYHVQHGLANAVALPYVLDAYRPKADADLARLANLVGAGESLTEQQKAAWFIESIRSLNRALDIPEHLEGLREEDVPQMAAWAAKEANPLYPVPVIFSRGDFERLIRKVGGLS